MKAITVFCGSSNGAAALFMEQAHALGGALATKQIQLIYGGAKVGLMGAVADGALQAQGEVIGVLPKFLQTKEIAHTGLSALHLVASMHERKTMMNDLCDGVIALPGGFGTLEELFEMLTWGQLGLHTKPIGILNSNGYYDALLQLLDGMVAQGFLKQANRDMVLVSASIEDLLTQMENYTAPAVPKWLNLERT
ncbi:TIGR00730 family Rossman fold protein [Croceivirga sp. JEA036]|uniref:LOG family protein n=1 Tax=Croceivirga sp. JEA036 TaxID=2721162 RepID=UPI00143ADD0D|nr:TIGR00730 family Rossman fold protein [Croceivirga sp. JEA036]NJB37850.1 TIGR00730 family Rossman fold protein [Croceivirga sp. JEA036]